MDVLNMLFPQKSEPRARGLLRKGLVEWVPRAEGARNGDC
jgi:hypothetical protein